MRITTRGEYGLRCVLDIAAKKGKVISIRQIVASEKLPKDYVEQLLIKLRRKNIIKSMRGVKGGYLLARKPQKITIYDIITSLEDEVFGLFCDRVKKRKSKCVHINDCRIRSFWLSLKKDMEKALKSKSIASLL